LPRRGLKQALLLEIEALQLKLALRRERFALRVEPRRERRIRQCAGAAQQELALDLLLLELALRHALLELKLLEPPRVRGSDVVTRRAQRLLEVQIERVLLLLELKLSARAGQLGCARRTRAGEQEKAIGRKYM
jgi:hypothetical protein